MRKTRKGLLALVCAFGAITPANSQFVIWNPPFYVLKPPIIAVM